MSETVNPFARPPSCERCRDARAVSRSSRFRREDLVPCPVCGGLTAEEYDDLTRRAWLKNHPPPGICELDLTAEELSTFRRLKSENPRASKLTVLAWIEGQRYEPANDPDLAQVLQNGTGHRPDPNAIGLPRATWRAEMAVQRLPPSLSPDSELQSPIPPEPVHDRGHASTNEPEPDKLPDPAPNDEEGGPW